MSTSKNLNLFKDVQLGSDYSRYSSVRSICYYIVRPSQSAVQAKITHVAKLTTMYKLINDNLHIPFNHLTPNHRDSRDGYFMQLQCRTEAHKFSFFPSTIKLWNSLPLYN